MQKIDATIAACNNVLPIGAEDTCPKGSTDEQTRS
jgi:hypothetical protein